jgi:3-oxoadipate enol-lactonase
MSIRSRAFWVKSGLMPHVSRPDGTKIWFEVFGDPEGEPLLMIQGLGASSRGWIRQRRAFSRQFRCIAFDNRGAGHSDKPEGPYDLSEMAEDALAVLDAAGFETAHIMGASMGGVIAQILAVLHPDRVRSLVLACTACHHHEWRRELLAEWAQTAQEKGMRHVAGRSLRWIIGSRMRRRLELPASLLWPLIAAAPAHAFVSQVEAILNADDTLREELRTLRVPTLVITGSQDILTPVGDAEELAEVIPGAELVIVPGGAHAVMVDKAPAFNDAVLSFLERHRTSVTVAPGAEMPAMNLPLASA